MGVSKFSIDLGVIYPEAPGKILAGVECDGATYHSSPSARDRDRIRHIILERLGWQLFRILSTDWFIDPEARLQKINLDLLALLEKDRQILAERDTNSPSQEETPDLPEVTAWVENIKDEHEAVNVLRPSPVVISTPVSTPAFDLGAHQTGSVAPAAKKLQPTFDITGEQAPLTDDAPLFHEPSYPATIRQLALAHIAAEAHITYKILSDLIAREHGFKRTGGQISSTVWDAIKNIPNCTRVSDGHTVYWAVSSDLVC
jgi:REase_MTES_1575/Protein of unknown function (DUF3320)